MAITEKDEELIEYGFVMAFLPGLPQNTETAKKALAAWDQLLALMERENNLTLFLNKIKCICIAHSWHVETVCFLSR